jgi:trehalose-phosphatase
MTAVDVTATDLARMTVDATRPTLIGLDVDGVLAPIVERADRAVLVPGMAEVLAELAGVLPVAIVSGRSVDDLEQRYGFPEQITVVGSHGLETRAGPPLVLDNDERARLDSLIELAETGVEVAGTGAWVEHKPASVVLHTREADPQRAERATTLLLERAPGIDGAHAKQGHAVVELMCRTTSKAAAIGRLRHHIGAATVVFAGDDHTDEEVFAGLEPSDLSVRVGTGPTKARYRLADPTDVLDWLRLVLVGLSRRA